VLAGTLQKLLDLFSDKRDSVSTLKGDAMKTLIFPSALFAYDAEKGTMSAVASTLESYMWNSRNPTWNGYLAHVMPDGTTKQGMYVKSAKTGNVRFFELSTYVYERGEDRFDKIRNDLGLCVASKFVSPEVEGITIVVDGMFLIMSCLSGFANKHDDDNGGM
jgi:hypothetical protein